MSDGNRGHLCFIIPSIYLDTLDTAPCAEECERRLLALRATVTRQLEEVRRCREDKARLEQEAGRLRARADSDCMR